MKSLAMAVGLIMLVLGTAGSAVSMLSPEQQLFAQPACCGGKSCKSSTTSKNEDKLSMAKEATSYPLSTCIVSGEELGSMGDAISYDYKGREIKFCCKGCIKKFEENAGDYIKKLDDSIIKDQTKTYPLDVCIVSGEALGGEMGDPVDMVYNNRLVRLCCKMCKKEFHKDPEKYLSKLDKALAAEKSGEDSKKNAEEKDNHSGHGSGHKH